VISKDAKALGLLALIVLATGLPFVHRPYFVDDYYFVTMAKGILQNPWRPYDFKSDDAGIGNVGWERGQRPRMVNPPLFHYYLAGVIGLFGDAPWKLRASSLLFSLVAVIAMYFQGKRWCPDSLTATLLMALCPAYWLTSYSLLIDSALVAFLLASLWAFVIGQERRSMAWVLVSGLLMGLTMSVKYFGVIVVLIALSWQLVDSERRKWLSGYLAYGAFALVQLAWALWNIATYGRSHFLAALPRGMESPSLIAWAQKALVVAGFLGGGLIFILVAPLFLWRLSRAWVVVLAILFAGLAALLASKAGGFAPDQAILLTFFIIGAAAFLVVTGRTIDLTNRNQVFLGLWAALGLLELVIVMPWTAGRYFLCVLPAIAWIFVLQLEKFGSPVLRRSVLGVTALAGLALAHADYVQANTIVRLADSLRRRAAEFQVMAPKPHSHWYYLADTFDGSQPYLEPLGWQNVLPHQKFQKGDLFLRAYYRKSSWWNVGEEMRQFRPVARLEVRSWNPLRVMDVPASAGFYASCWGALPWAITNHPLERFELYQAVSE
jgi:4-amino-4-deoxy-L-arabinose transferase-like glycosyltransferase